MNEHVDKMLSKFYDSYLSLGTMDSPAKEALNNLLSSCTNDREVYLEMDSLLTEALTDEGERAFKTGFRAAVTFLMGVIL